VYSLFIRREQSGNDLPLPAWLRVKQIGQLKQVVAEVIVVILFVLFLRAVLQSFQDPLALMTWERIMTFLPLPACTMRLALALRLVRLHPKPDRPILEDANSDAHGEAPRPPVRPGRQPTTR